MVRVSLVLIRTKSERNGRYSCWMNTSLLNGFLTFSSHLGNFGEEKGLGSTGRDSQGCMGRLAVPPKGALLFLNMPGPLLPNF